MTVEIRMLVIPHLHSLIRHKETGDIYIIRDMCSMRFEDGSWHSAYIYKRYGSIEPLFVRPENAFLSDKWEIVG